MADTNIFTAPLSQHADDIIPVETVVPAELRRRSTPLARYAWRPRWKTGEIAML